MDNFQSETFTEVLNDYGPRDIKLTYHEAIAIKKKALEMVEDKKKAGIKVERWDVAKAIIEQAIAYKKEKCRVAA